MLRCLRSPDLPSSGAVDVRVMLSSDQALAPEDGGELMALIDDWAWLVAHGGFCAPPVRPVDSTLRAVTVLADGGGIHAWRFDLQSVHPGAFDVLCHALYAYGRIVHPIEEVSVLPQVPPHGPRTPPSWGPLAVDPRRYPPLAVSQLGFGISRSGRISTGATRRMQIRFAAPLDEATEQALHALIGHWEMVVFCAYPSTLEDLEAGRCAIFNAETAGLDDGVVELCIEDFGGVDSAWHPLLNALGAMSASGPRVLDVAID
jgi:hypothetical protein